MATIIPREKKHHNFVQKHVATSDYRFQLNSSTKKAHKTQRLFNRFTQTASLEKKRHRFKGVTVIMKNIVNGGSASDFIN